MDPHNAVTKITEALERLTERADRAADQLVEQVSHYVSFLVTLARTLADATYRLLRALLVSLLKLAGVAVRLLLLVLSPMFAIAFGLELRSTPPTLPLSVASWFLILTGAAGVFVPVALLLAAFFPHAPESESPGNLTPVSFPLSRSRPPPRYRYGGIFVVLDICGIALVGLWSIVLSPGYEFEKSVTVLS